MAKVKFGETQCTEGRGGLFWVPEFDIPVRQVTPSIILHFFREAWHINGKAVGDVNRGAKEDRAEQLVIPPTSEKPQAVIMDYAYTYRRHTRSGKALPSLEEYEVSATSTDSLFLIPQLGFSYDGEEFAVGDDTYSHSHDTGWLVSSGETGDQYIKPTSDHREHLGSLATDFIKLVSA